MHEAPVDTLHNGLRIFREQSYETSAAILFAKKSGKGLGKDLLRKEVSVFLMLLWKKAKQI